jgi:hypothetical protein
VAQSMGPSNLKLDDEKLKYAVLAQQNGFWPNIFPSYSELLVKGRAHKCDVTAAPYIRLANHMIGLGRLLLVVPTYLQSCSPGFSFMGGVEKKKITNLGCEK